MSKASIIVIISACVLGVAAAVGAVALSGRLIDDIRSSAVAESDGTGSEQIRQDEYYSGDVTDEMTNEGTDATENVNSSKNSKSSSGVNKTNEDETGQGDKSANEGNESGTVGEGKDGESVAESKTENIEDDIVERIITGNSTAKNNSTEDGGAGEDVRISGGEVSTSKIDSEDGEIENRVDDVDSGNNGNDNDNDVTGDDDSSEDEYEPETVDLNQYDYEAILEADSDTQKKIVQTCGSYEEYIKMLNEKESEAEKAGKLKDISGDGKADMSDG